MSAFPAQRSRQLAASEWFLSEHPRDFKNASSRSAVRTTQAVEITSGLSAGEQIAVKNTFLLKAELGKGDAGEGD